MQKLNTYEATPWVVGYQCCIVIYSFISFGLILVSVFSQTKLMDNAPQMYSDWDQPLILDLQVKEACSGGYVNILNFTWPGTASGCDCTNSNGTDKLSYSKYYYMECSEFMLSENCQPVKSLQETQFMVWPVEQKGYMMCAKLSNYTAMESFTTEDPKLGYKKCGNIWQVPTTDDCPISSFAIGTQGTPIGTSGASYQIARVQGDAVPLASFTIGYNSICYDIAQIYEFQYLDNLIHYQCFTEDSRYQRITNDATYTDLLKVNGQWDSYSSLYGSTNILSRNVNLFSKQFTQFYYNSSQLCQPDDLSFIHDLNWYIKDSVMDVQLAAQVVVGIQAGVFGFLIPLISAISLVGCEFKYTRLSRKSSHYKDLFGFWLGVKMISEILCTIMLASDMGYQNQMMKHFADYINANCSDTLTLAEMSSFYNNYEIYVYNYVLLNFILCIITNVMDIFATYLMCRDKHKQGIPIEERTHPKNYTSTHPDELINRIKVQPASSIKKRLSDREIPDDDVAKNVPDD